MITLTNGQTTQEGTVSWGTLRPLDIIPALLDECWSCGLLTINMADKWITKGALETEYHNDVLDELFDMLNSVAPDGYYFGAHCGDGSDYGWWQYGTD